MPAGRYATLVQDEQVSTHAPVARVLICDPIPAVAVERMRAGGLHVDERAGLSREELEARIGDYDAVVAVSRFQNRISASYSLKTEHALHRDFGTVEQVRRITSL